MPRERPCRTFMAISTALLMLACDSVLIEEPIPGDSKDMALFDTLLPDTALPDLTLPDTSLEDTTEEDRADTFVEDTAPDVIETELPPPIPAEIFAHGPSTLYRLDPDLRVLITLGAFRGCSSVLDLAIDQAGRIFVTASGGLYQVDRNTLACTRIAAGNYPNSLTFIPPGILDLENEVLVGYFGSDYVRIDTETGTVQTIGRLQGGYASSGDVISVPGGGTYLTATGSNCLQGDCLLEVDPVSGDLKAKLLDLPYDAVYGMAFSRGRAYGFTSGGDAFEVIFAEDGSITTEHLPFPSAPTFWGASSLWTE